MDGYTPLNEAANLEKLKAGMKGGDTFKDPVLTSHKFVDGVNAEIQAKYGMPNPTPSMKINDPWVARYPNSKI